MKLNKPILILDTEATGLDTEKAELIQIAAVYVEDLSIPFSEQKKYTATIQYDKFSYVDPKALKILANLDLIGGVGAREAMHDLRMFFLGLPKDGAVQLAGKNLGAYDLPILRRYLSEDAFAQFDYRILDIGNLYYPDFLKVPSSNEINTLIGRGAVNHTALADCEDVFEALKYKLLKAEYRAFLEKAKETK